MTTTRKSSDLWRSLNFEIFKPPVHFDLIGTFREKFGFIFRCLFRHGNRRCCVLQVGAQQTQGIEMTAFHSLNYLRKGLAKTYSRHWRLKKLSNFKVEKSGRKQAKIFQTLWKASSLLTVLVVFASCGFTF